MTRFLLLVSVLLMMAACKTDQAAQEVSVAEDFSLRITRTPCYGTCPAFTLTVDAKGNVAYTGRNFVDNVGEFQKKLKPKDLRALVHSLESGGFWEYKEEYDDAGVTDLPAVITAYTHRGQSRQVVNRVGAPESLGELQAKLEEIIGDGGYKPVSTAN